ncbi:MAG: hypothetical protein EBU66_16895, partial [Bacteroidetes bacterium]|nr:hypothetical protein [Bacteroidota bacterium]
IPLELNILNAINNREKIFIISVLAQNEYNPSLTEALQNLKTSTINSFKDINTFFSKMTLTNIKESAKKKYKVIGDYIKAYPVDYENYKKCITNTADCDKDKFKSLSPQKLKMFAAAYALYRTGVFIESQYENAFNYLMIVNTLLFLGFTVLLTIKVTDLIKALRVGKINSALCEKNILERETPRYRFFKIKDNKKATLTGIFLPYVISTILVAYLAYKLNKKEGIDNKDDIKLFAILSVFLTLAVFTWMFYVLIYVKKQYKEYEGNMKTLLDYVYKPENLTNFTIKSKTRRGRKSVTLEQSNEGMKRLHDTIVKRILALENLTTMDEAEGRYSDMVKQPIQLFGYTQFDLDSDDYENIRRALQTWRTYKQSDIEMIDNCNESLRWLSSSQNYHYDDMKEDFKKHHYMCFYIFIVYSIIIYFGYHKYYREYPTTGILGLVAFLLVITIVIYIFINIKYPPEEQPLRLPNLIPLQGELDNRLRVTVVYKLEGYNRTTLTPDLQNKFKAAVASQNKLLTPALTLGEIKDDGSVSIMIRYGDRDSANNAIKGLRRSDNLNKLQQLLKDRGFTELQSVSVVGIPVIG